MALSKNIEFKGLAVSNCYIKICKFEGDKNTLSFWICYFSSKDNEMLKSETFECSYDLNGNNPIAQAYDYLKTLDEFKDAEDV